MLSTAVEAACNGVVFALLADLREAHGFSRDDLALISSIVFFVGLITQLLVAGYADRGHSRKLLLVGLACAAAALLWFAAAESLWQFVAARALSGFGTGAFLPAARAMVAGHDPDNAGHNLGRLTSYEIGGFVLGPAVGSIVADRWGLDAPFLLLAVPCIAGFVFLALSGPLPERHMAKLPFWRTSGLDLLRYRSVFAAALFAMLLYLPVGIYDALWDQYLTDLGASQIFTGVSLSLYGVPIILLGSSGGRLGDRYGAIRAGLFALIVIIPATTLYGLVTSYWLVAGIALIEACAQAVASPSAQSAMALACPADRVAAGQGLSGSMGLAAAGTMAWLGPKLYARHGAPFTFVTTGTAMVVLALAVMVLSRARLGVTDHEPAPA
jgi:MFS family permease